MEILEQIKNLKLVPVVVIEDSENAEGLAKALIDGGLPVAEVTFRTAAAAKSIEIMSEKYPEMLVGAGTVINVEQAKLAIASGAKFIVTPGFSKAVTEYCLSNDIPIVPGISTATELMAALDCGVTTVKFFPAEQYGGLATIKALAAPFTNVTFIPTGGVNENNVREYLSFNKVLACGGSWMVKPALINAKEFDKIRDLVVQSVNLVK